MKNTINYLADQYGAENQQDVPYISIRYIVDSMK
jgi:hypothetical protein